MHPALQLRRPLYSGVSGRDEQSRAGIAQAALPRTLSAQPECAAAGNRSFAARTFAAARRQKRCPDVQRAAGAGALRLDRPRRSFRQRRRTQTPWRPGAAQSRKRAGKNPALPLYPPFRQNLRDKFRPADFFRIGRSHRIDFRPAPAGDPVSGR
ncbi:hypothetical protein SDC9_126168 [bioreactor metagenome]|uniref:Uncharacterized protein n=1 Tax=bioreactor metagenome TaxID=1076179 RepID=A0A645CPY4_9ZZZZ